MDNLEKIWAYIDGNMNKEEQQSFEVLLHSNPDLKNKFDEINLTNSLLSSKIKWSAPLGIENKILKRIKSESIQSNIDFLPIKYMWLAVAGSIGLITLYLSFNIGVPTEALSGYWETLSNIKLQQDYSALLESCKTYIYLSFFCAAIFTFALILDQFTWPLLSARNYKL